MKCSIVLSTIDKHELLELSLQSIFKQQIPFDYEVLVVNDGHENGTHEVCARYPVKYLTTNNPEYGNPATARNLGYRTAKGEVIICQCDDIVHITPDSISRLVLELSPREFLLAKVENWNYQNGEPLSYIMDYCSPDKRPVPYFFLGAIARSDLYAVGGNDEDFKEPCYEDNWFADCLIRGINLSPRYSPDIMAHHISHSHPKGGVKDEAPSKALYERKLEVAERTGLWVSSGGFWSEREPIPKTMNFFWTANPLSWCRYLTVKSFVHHNPDWRVRVFRSSISTPNVSWRTPEIQDCGVYAGRDYMEDVKLLDVEVLDWECSIENLAPAHASDLFQWELLATEGGFYADMDILFVRAMPYEKIKYNDLVYCFSKGFATIGYFGSSGNNELFRDIRFDALDSLNRGTYQCTGAEVFYRLAKLRNWGRITKPGDLAMMNLQTVYPYLKMESVRDKLLYPWAWDNLNPIWEECHAVSPVCSGIHWFGGAPLSQRMNNLLTPENVDRYPCTFTKYASQLL